MSHNALHFRTFAADRYDVKPANNHFRPIQFELVAINTSILRSTLVRAGDPPTPNSQGTWETIAGHDTSLLIACI